ncbi:MAG: RIP metalloprotease RseP [Pseudomonadota bacterium]
MDLLNTLFFTLLALGVLVTIHELGHFLVARWCGVKVLHFSVGFGKPLFSWVDKVGTQYSVSMIPLGGYVKMLDERGGAVDAAERHQAFNTQPLKQRMAIVSAGPIANFLLAWLLFYVLFLGGMTEHKALIKKVSEGSVAHAQGMINGEEIVSINGEAVASRQALSRKLMDFYGQPAAPITLGTRASNDQVRDYAMTLDWRSSASKSPLELLGIELFRPKVSTQLLKVLHASPASSAGLKEGDRLLRVNDQEIAEWDGWARHFRASPDQSLRVEFEREGVLMAVNLTPKATNVNGERVGQVGVVPVLEAWPDDVLVRRDYSWFDAWRPAIFEVRDKSLFTLSIIKKMLTGHVSVKEVGGPVAIAQQASMSSKLGWRAYISLLALLSISLGVLNLLPIPVLDGGHLMFYVIEGIRGKALSERAQTIAFQVGGVLVLSFMLFAIVNDIARL